MKIHFLVVLGVLALLPAFTAQAQASPSARHREITVWVQGQLGSHLGSGYASTYLTNIRARTIKQEDPKLREAIDSLDGLGMLQVRGFGLVPAAVAWQSNKPMRKVIEQQAETGLSYGELLIANVLAAKSRESFDQVVARRTRTRTWGELAGQLHVDPGLLVTRANIASQRILAAESQTRRHTPREGGTNFTSTNPHIQHARHH
jgi:hypothetical protein